MFSSCKWAPLWDSEANMPATTANTTIKSSKVAHFRCSALAGRQSFCGYAWTDKPANMEKKKDSANPCPHCRSQKPVYCGDAGCALCAQRSVLCPALSAFVWQAELNVDADGAAIEPLSVSAHSNTKYWLTCPQCRQPWHKSPNDLMCNLNQRCRGCYSSALRAPAGAAEDATAPAAVSALNATSPATGSAIESAMDSDEATGFEETPETLVPEPSLTASTSTSSRAPSLWVRPTVVERRPPAGPRTTPLNQAAIHDASCLWILPLLSAHPGVVQAERSGWNGGIDFTVVTAADGQMHPLMIGTCSQNVQVGKWGVQFSQKLVEQSTIIRAGGRTRSSETDTVDLYHNDQVRFVTSKERDVFIVCRLGEVSDPQAPLSRQLSVTVNRVNKSHRGLWYAGKVFTQAAAAIDRLVEILVGSRVLSQADTLKVIQPSLRQEVAQHFRLETACQLLGLTCRREAAQHTTVDARVNEKRVQLKVGEKQAGGFLRIHCDKRAGFKVAADSRSIAVMVPYDEEDFDFLMVDCEQDPGKFWVAPMTELVAQRKVSSRRLGQTGVQMFTIPAAGVDASHWSARYWNAFALLH